MSVPVGVNWLNIPQELRDRHQWCVAAENKMPLVLDAEHKNLIAARVDEKVFMSFEWAASAAYKHGAHIGYVLTDEDPFCCIDLDVKPTTTAADMEYFMSIVTAFDSYAEFSRSGQGMHIWARGNIGPGARHAGLEVYSQQRFIICTGNVYKNKPILDKQKMLEQLVLRIRTVQRYNSVLIDEEDVDSDDEVFQRAVGATNGEKFAKLCRGEWRGDYPSQSEADMALMSMFTFYSPSNEQCRRLFRMSGLGQREKAQRDKYLDYMIGMKRGQQQEQEETMEMVRSSSAHFVDTLRQATEKKSVAPYVGAPAQLTAEQLELAQQGIQQLQSGEVVVSGQGNAFASALAVEEFKTSELSQEEGALAWPPGFMGVLAAFIYQASPRPVREVAIVAALGLVAGLCGRNYNISNTGLNMYIVLVAKSGVGKEAMHTGISTLVRDCGNNVIMDRVSFADFASGPALMKHCEVSKCFVNVAGEFGRKLSRMGSDQTEGPMHTLRTAMTNLYQKSGHKSMVGGLSYSNSDKNVASVDGVSFSMIGETTPDTFYQSLTHQMMEDGFLSRFNIVEYNGDRPAYNEAHLREAPVALRQAVIALAGDSATATRVETNGPIEVGYEPSAKAMLDAFNLECDRQINSTTDESFRQMWNRAHLKSLRLSALLAVCDNNVVPQITMEHAAWALHLVRKDTMLMQKKLETGDVGLGDHARDMKMASILHKYMTAPHNDKYAGTPAMHKAGIIARSYISVWCNGLAAFHRHPFGARRAIEDTIRNYIDNGWLREVEFKTLTALGFTGKAYYVTGLPDTKAQFLQKD